MNVGSPLLAHRKLWSIDSLTRDDLLAQLDTARQLENAARAGPVALPLRGKNLALLGQARGAGASWLRCAATGLGARLSQLRPSTAQMTNGAIHGTAQLLGRLYDAIDCVAMAPATVQQIDADAGVPVYNGLADDEHPVYVLTELMAIHEHSGKALAQLCVCFIGDARTQRGDALLQAAALTGMHLHVVAPKMHWPNEQRVHRAWLLAQASGARPCLLEPGADATTGADFVVDARAGQHWDISAGGTAIDDFERSNCRHFMLQALLVNTMA